MDIKTNALKMVNENYERVRAERENERLKAEYARLDRIETVKAVIAFILYFVGLVFFVVGVYILSGIDTAPFYITGLGLALTALGGVIFYNTHKLTD